MLVSPFVGETPDGVFVVIDKRFATEHARFLIHVETYAASALEHVVSEVHVSTGEVVGSAVILVQTDDFVFPDGEGVQDVDELTIAEGSAVSGDAVAIESFGSLIGEVVLDAAAGPDGVYVVSDHIHADVGSVGAHLVHFFVGFVEAEITVHLCVDEVNLDGGFEVPVHVRIVANIGEAIVGKGIVNDVDAVGEAVVIFYGVSSVKVSAALSFEPGDDVERDALSFFKTADGDGMLTLADADAGDAGVLVVVLSGSVHGIGECLRRDAADVVSHAIVLVVGSVEERLCER